MQRPLRGSGAAGAAGAAPGCRELPWEDPWGRVLQEGLGQLLGGKHREMQWYELSLPFGKGRCGQGERPALFLEGK